MSKPRRCRKPSPGPARQVVSEAFSSRYPFSGLVGQEELKLALLLNAIDLSIGGVLVRGEKGTAKSTAARSLSSLLPEIQANACAFGCAPEGPLCPKCRQARDLGEDLKVTCRPVPFVDLPVGATEDRVLGGLDFETALSTGRRVFQPGLLGKAHRGILYVDEVNLLPDHLVDVILDASSSGWNTVSREGVQYCHPAAFLLVGTMNPEEGSLRPHFLDRFGLCVDTASEKNVAERIEILTRRMCFESDRASFLQKWSDKERELLFRLEKARERVCKVQPETGLEKACAVLAAEAGAHGSRAELTMFKAARALAAFEHREICTSEDVRRISELALTHRRRESRQKSPTSPPDQDHSQHMNQPKGETPGQSDEPSNPDISSSQDPLKSPDHAKASATRGPTPDRVDPPGDPFEIRDVRADADRLQRTSSGRRTRSMSAKKSGRYVRNILTTPVRDLALDATIRAAAPYQIERGRSDLALHIRREDFRERVRQSKVSNLIVFLVDASGSMGAANRMSKCKAAVLSLLLDAYRCRDKVAFLAFRRDRAEILLPPTSSVERARRLLQELPTGGRTPLAHGLCSAYELIETQLRRTPGCLPLLLVISDGKANAAVNGGKPLDEALKMADYIGKDRRITSIVLDPCLGGYESFGLAQTLAERLQAQYSSFSEFELKSATVNT